MPTSSWGPGRPGGDVEGRVIDGACDVAKGEAEGAEVLLGDFDMDLRFTAA